MRLGLLHERAWLGDLLALGSGLLTVVAFAPYSIAPLAVIGPALLFLSWLEATPRRMAWRGYLFGLGLFGFGVSWITSGLSLFGAHMQALALPLASVFVLVLALYPGIMGWVASRFAGLSAALRLILIWPALWTAFEWLRGTLFTGFPWLLLGDSQVASAPGGFAPVLGDYGVSWLVATLAGLLVCIVACRRAILRIGAAAMVLVLWFGVGALRAVDWTHPTGAPMRVSVVQGNVPQQTKWRPETFMRTLTRYRDLTRAHWDSRLIVWPESAIPALYRQVAGDYLDPLAAEAASHGSALMVGLFVKRGKKIYNAVASLGAAAPEFYFKHHLVPFGEYMPFKHLLGWLYRRMDVPMSGLSPGHGGYTVQAAGQTVDVSICYEDAYGDIVIRGLPQASLLVNVSDDAWFGDSLEPAQHMQIGRMRALETGRYLLRAANTGISGIVGPKGEVLALADQDRTEVLTAEVRPMGGATPYVRLGNTPVIALVFGVVLLGWFAGRLINRSGNHRGQES
ncbi:apolipoprotein N-acyltransferase [Acidihalobacter aeolianus]|uniref:Apolipoprotein N-acyltransferase n=1 Tax=Acidihalobacter aeolianus TaxID=2792603 RepID=A0A1D8K9B9_9GAMM|nr:apolipoprotein N-acyltransferase [Acidihalobacter aeolianus]AOV17556.1 apolipoprotein N-acyltransferase [Acidihalobacter aeolianus]